MPVFHTTGLVVWPIVSDQAVGITYLGLYS